MGVTKNEMQLARFEYDFAEDGGAIGSIDLRSKVVDLPAGAVITDLRLHVVTGVTSGGTPTITLGNAAAADGYLADVFALVGSDNAVVRAGTVAGSLLWDDVNDHLIDYYVTSANTEVKLAIGTAAVTAGKLNVYVSYYVPVAV